MKLKKKIIIVFLIGLSLTSHLSLKSQFNSKIQNHDFTIFDKIKSTQNHILSKLYKPLGKIPVHRIEISEINHQYLLQNPKPFEQDYVKGQWILPNNQKQKVELRFRGSSKSHWAYPKTSWRIKVKNKIENRSIFNFINPRHQSHIIYPLGSYLGKNAKLLSPKHNFVALYLNDEYQGLYSDIEQTDQDFLKNNHKAPGDIYNGEPPFKPKENIELLQGSKIGIFESIDLWDYKKIEVKNEDKLQELLNIVQNGLSPTYPEEISEIIDLEKTLKHIALQNLMASNHIDNFHNFKIYFNPQSQKFDPILWDLISWINPDPEYRISTTENTLFNQLISIPEFKEQKNKYLWEFLNDFASVENIHKFIDAQAKQIEHEILFDPNKDYVDANIPDWNSRPLSFNDWEKSIDTLKFWYQLRHEFIVKELNQAKIGVYFLKKENLLIIDQSSETPWQLIENGKETNLKLYPQVKIEKIQDIHDRDIETVINSTKRYEYSRKDSSELQITLRNTITNNIVEPYINLIDNINELPPLQN